MAQVQSTLCIGPHWEPRAASSHCPDKEKVPESEGCSLWSSNEWLETTLKRDPRTAAAVNTEVRVFSLRILYPAGEMHIMWCLGIFNKSQILSIYTIIKQIKYLLLKKILEQSQVKHMSKCTQSKPKAWNIWELLSVTEHILIIFWW